MAKGTCSVIDSGRQCDRALRYTDLCEMHYQRLRLSGTTDRPPRGTDIWEGTEFKTCRTCGEVKLRAEFSMNNAKRDKKMTHCKTCALDGHRKRTYGLSPVAFAGLLAFQGGVCGLCEGPSLRKGWIVEHDHVTGETRAIVCERCNLLLGMALDDIDRLRAAIAYLEHPPMSRMVQEVT